MPLPVTSAPHFHTHPRLVHIAGARQVLAAALAEALPLPPEPSAAAAAAGAPPPAPPPVAMFAYVEVPPILPGDGSLSAYACREWQGWTGPREYTMRGSGRWLGRAFASAAKRAVGRKMVGRRGLHSSCGPNAFIQGTLALGH